jgi:hypothetical protein
MDAQTRVKRVYTEAQLQAALSSINEIDGWSIRATATAYAVPGSTLRNRLAGHTSCSSAHEHRQNLLKRRSEDTCEMASESDPWKSFTTSSSIFDGRSTARAVCRYQNKREAGKVRRA